MSKCNINNCQKNNKKCSNLERKLSEIGLTVEEVKKWLETEENSTQKDLYPDDQALFSFLGIETGPAKKTAAKAFVEQNSQDYFARTKSSNPTGNVTFVPAKKAEDVGIYVAGEQMQNVTYVQLSYDPDSNMPKLTIEITNPLVSSCVS